MPSKDRRQHRIPENTTKTKRAKQITTIEDLFARDDVNDVLAEVNKLKPNISDLIVIYVDRRSKDYGFQITNGTPDSTAVWMLEKTKFNLLNGDYEVEE